MGGKDDDGNKDKATTNGGGSTPSRRDDGLSPSHHHHHHHHHRSRSRDRDRRRSRSRDGNRRRSRSRSRDRDSGRKRRRSRTPPPQRVSLPGGEGFYPRYDRITSYKAQKLYVFNGLRRSGNHLAIQYVISGLGDGQVVLLNDVVRRVLEKGQGKLSDCLPWAIVQEDNNFGEVVNRKLMTRQALHNLLQEGGVIPCLVVSLEEKSVDNSRSILRFFSALLPDSNAPSKLVLVCRDILNTVASRLEFNASVRLNGIIMPVDDETVKFWRSYLVAGQGDESIVLFNYNRFLLEEDYRRHIAQAFGMDHASLIDSEVPRFGLGSSFTRSHERQNKDDYLSRWIRFQTNDVITSCLKNPEIRSILMEQFGGQHLRLPPLDGEGAGGGETTTATTSSSGSGGTAAATTTSGSTAAAATTTSDSAVAAPSEVMTT